MVYGSQLLTSFPCLISDEWTENYCVVYLESFSDFTRYSSLVNFRNLQKMIRNVRMTQQYSANLLKMVANMRNIIGKRFIEYCSLYCKHNETRLLVKFLVPCKAEYSYRNFTDMFVQVHYPLSWYKYAFRITLNTTKPISSVPYLRNSLPKGRICPHLSILWDDTHISW